MGFLNFFLGEKKSSASVAKERLQLILAHERNGRSSSPDYLPQLQRELVAVISKYVQINSDDIKVHMERQGDLEVLEVKIELPDAPMVIEYAGAVSHTPTPEITQTMPVTTRDRRAISSRNPGTRPGPKVSRLPRASHHSG